MKALHLSYHEGCIKDFEYVANQIGLNLETLRANRNYNIGYNRAKEIWMNHKDYFESFDTIITSDTAPLSRIFLQNNYKGKLIIWICNRFDYCDMATNDCGFPDKEYYEIFKNAIHKDNVSIASYTEFEYIYARRKNINISDLTVKPTGKYAEYEVKNPISDEIKENSFFITPYHNDTIFMNLKEKCESLGIKCYNGRYYGPDDLKGFKGIIHIPYAWSNIALFENVQNEMIYFIPSKRFISELYSTIPNFFFSPPFNISDIEYSEWYNPTHEKWFVYFDDWEDLRTKINNLNFNEKKTEIKSLCEEHYIDQINKWKKILI